MDDGRQGWEVTRWNRGRGDFRVDNGGVLMNSLVRRQSGLQRLMTDVLRTDNNDGSGRPVLK